MFKVLIRNDMVLNIVLTHEFLCMANKYFLIGYSGLLSVINVDMKSDNHIEMHKIHFLGF